MDFLNFIQENSQVLIAVYYVLGMFMKSTEAVKDKYIPTVLLVISLGFTPLVLGSFTDPQNYVQAILVVAGAVLINQIPKQLTKGE